MKAKRIVCLIVSTVLLSSLMITSVYAESISVYSESINEDKRKLMIAAGEIPPDDILVEADIKIKKDEAIELAKAMVEDGNEYEINNAYLSQKWDMKVNFWSIDLYFKGPPGGSINVGIDADTGEIISFNKWEYSDGQKNFVANVTKDEARKIAEKYLKEKMGNDFSTFELQKDPPYYYNYNMGGIQRQVVYNFSYIKKINGVKFQDYILNVGVDGTTGKVQSYSINRVDVDTSKLPPVKDAITAGEAMKKYMDSATVGMQYVIMYEERPFFQRSQQNVRLVYMPLTSIGIIDALTGKYIEYDGKTIEKLDDLSKVLSEKPLQINPDAKLEIKKLTEKEVEDLALKYKASAEEIFGIKFEDKGMPYGRSIYSGSNEMVSFNWYKNPGSTNYGMNISINEETGHINNLSLDKYTFEDRVMMDGQEKAKEVKEKYNWSQCKKKAMELLEKLVPDQYGFYEDQNVSEPNIDENYRKYSGEYNYHFIRVVNGIRFRDNSINISIDRETGELTNFYFNWNDVDFPKADNIIDSKKAAALCFESIEPVLSYRCFTSYDDKTGMPKVSENPSLVYTFNNKYNDYFISYVDAESGKYLDWSGREISKENAGLETKLPNHWAKRSVELLIDQGILQKTDIKYENEVTRAEAVKMMSIAKGMVYFEPIMEMEPSFIDVGADNEYYQFIENAIGQKIIIKTNDKFNGDESITKEEFAQLLINLVGYADIAKHNTIYKLPENINSSDPELIGSLAICHALGILPVKYGEKFEGSEKVTYAEAAVALYKALSQVR